MSELLTKHQINSKPISAQVQSEIMAAQFLSLKPNVLFPERPVVVPILCLQYSILLTQTLLFT